MAVSKNQTGRKKSSGKKSSGSAGSRKKRAQSNAAEGFQTEILLLIILALCALLMIGNLGMGGDAGRAVSAVSFGVMGMMSYVFPVFLFLGAAFLVSNRHNPLAYKKILAAVVCFLFLCGFIQLLTEGYLKSTTLADYYAICADYRTGGGVLGGAICISTTSAFGTVGSYIIICAVLLICLIVITQRSFFGFMGRIADGLALMLKGGQELYREGQPERDLKKEIRQQERRQRREERRRLLEEELEQLEEESDEETEGAGAEMSGPSGRKKAGRKGAAASSGTVPVSGRTRKFQTPPVLQPESGDVSGGKKKGAPGREAEEEIIEDTPEALSWEEEELKEELSVKKKAGGEDFPEFKIHRSAPAAEMEEDFPEDLKGLPEDGMDGSALPEEDSLLPAKDPGEETLDALSGESASPEAPAPEEVPPGEKTRRRPAKNPRSSGEDIASGIEKIQHEIEKRPEPVKREYLYPPLKLLRKGTGKTQGDSDEHLRRTAKKLQETLQNFGVNVTVSNVSCGPTVTRYELQPEKGVKVSRIVGLSDDIKLNLAAPDIRIEAPIPGKAAVGIEVPNKENSPVMLRDLLQSREFQSAGSRLSFAVGKDIAGKPVVADIAKMPHLLIAGATGSGKSVCINTLIISLLYKASPEEVKLIMVDPKVVELSVYNGIPHLLIPVVTDPKKAAGALNWAVTEMNGRYNTFAEYRVRNLNEYNRKIEGMTIPEGETRPERLPQIVIIVDELADLMMVAPGEVEDSICRLAQLARAAGIHLIIATQRPSVNVITGLIKANMPSRIAFSVSSGVDSRTILDMHGAEKLLGKGDMLFYPQGYQKPARLQGAFVSDEEVSGVVEFLKEKNPGISYSSGIEQQMSGAGASAGSSAGDERDSYFEEAGKFIIDKEKASIGMLQRMFKIGFNRAARIMDQLADAGVVGPEEGTKPRKVLMTMEEFENYIEESL